MKKAECRTQNEAADSVSATHHSSFIIRHSPWLAGASALLYVCSRFVPCSPPVFHGEIEDSFIQYLHMAFVQHVQFGRDFIFNFGPWGFLYGGYYPATYPLAVVAWLGFAAVFWWAGWLAARHFSENRLAAWLWLMAFTAIAGLPIFTFVEARFKALVVLLWLLHFFVESRGRGPSPRRPKTPYPGGRASSRAQTPRRMEEIRAREDARPPGLPSADVSGKRPSQSKPLWWWPWPSPAW